MDVGGDGFVDGGGFGGTCGGFADHQCDLAFHGWARRESRANLGGGAAKEFLVQLGQFPRHYYGAQAENSFDIGKGIEYAVWSFVENERRGLFAQRFEGAGALAGFWGQKTAEVERIGGQARGGERCDDGGRPGNGDHRNAGANGGGGQSVSGVGHERHTGIGDQGDIGSGEQLGHQFLGARGFIVFVITDERPADFVVVEQVASMARILTSDQVHFAQGAYGAVGDVFQVADGRGHEIEN